MPDVRLHPAADAEYVGAFQRYGANSVRAAKGFERAVQDAIQKIVAMPQAYPAYDFRHRTFTLRKYPYYVVTGNRPVT